MDVRDLLIELARRGVTLRCGRTEDRLNAKPTSTLTPELVAAIRERKAEIIRVMRADEQDRRLEETGVIQSERQVFEMVRERLGGADPKGEARESG